MTRTIAALFVALPALAIAQERIAVVGDSLSEARARYAATTDVPRDDCDPVSGGRWVCASYNDPVLADVGDSSASVPSEPRRSETPPARGAAVIGASLADARERYARATSQRRVDCDPVGDGRWICASFDDPVMADLDGAPASGQAPVDAPRPPADAPSPKTSNDLPSGALYRSGDLIVLNYDSCPDPDDLHAAVAGRMVLDRFGLVRGRDYLVNNGTCGDLLSRGNYIERSPQVFTALYGDEGSTDTWLDAFDRESRSADLTALAMAEVLVQGRRVWVLDGGPSDFTHEVTRRLRDQGLSDSLTQVAVVQHSSWNERHTAPDHLADVQRRTDYRRIPDGNVAGNGTGQLLQATFGDNTRPDADLVARYRDDATYGAAWREAFKLLDPIDDKFDGSDTVELLWILGLREAEIADWYDVADRFLTETGTAVPSPVSAPSVEPAPEPASEPVLEPVLEPAPAASAGLRAQVESASPVGGWERTDAGLIWLGPDRYALASRSDDANLAYTVNVPAAGRYRFTMRSRATSRGLSAARYREEPPNDIWVTFGNRDWIKAYMTRDGDWHVQAIGELSDSNKKASNLESDLRAGAVTVTISGRSRGHEIDWIELQRVADASASNVAVEPTTDTPPERTSDASPEADVSGSLVKTGVTPGRTPGGLSWADSYIGTDGLCWPSSTWDHGIGDVRVDTPVGALTIREAARRLGPGPARQGDLAFNQIACRADTPNDAGDEDIDQCPGLVTRGRDGCDLVADVPNWWDRLR